MWQFSNLRYLSGVPELALARAAHQVTLAARCHLPSAAAENRADSGPVGTAAAEPPA